MLKNFKADIDKYVDSKVKNQRPKAVIFVLFGHLKRN